MILQISLQTVSRVCCSRIKSWLILLNIPSVDAKIGQAEEDLTGLHRPEVNRNQTSRSFFKPPPENFFGGEWLKKLATATMVYKGTVNLSAFCLESQILYQVLAKLERVKSMITRPPLANDDLEGRSEDDFLEWIKSKLKFAPDKVEYLRYSSTFKRL